MRQFELDRLKGKSPVRSRASHEPKVTKALEGPVDFVKAQVGIAIDIQLAIPLRPQNLSSLDWRRHFVEPDGPKGRLLLDIPRMRRNRSIQDFVAEFPDDVARRLRWYRRNILPVLEADP